MLLRADFNVPITKDFKVGQAEDYRLAQTVPTIKYLTSRGAKVIIMAHLGRPNGKAIERLKLDPVAVRLSQLLKRCVYKSDERVETRHGVSLHGVIDKLKNGEVLLLENIRFNKGEESAEPKFAKLLASLGDIFVNDGFAVSHRDQASVSAIQNYLPSYAGLLLEKEVLNLTRVLQNPKKPLVVIIGGAKISSKIKLIKNFLPLAQNILLGGALANTVLAAMGVSIGKSLIEKEMFREVKKIHLTNNQVRVPLDGIMAKSYQAKRGRIDALADIKKDELILDIGPETVNLYEKIIKTAKMVVWNGPMGLIENPVFSQGTRALIKILAHSKAETIVGGGETAQMIRKMGLQDKFSFISTGGGAMLEFLEGKKLPGLKKILNIN